MFILFHKMVDVRHTRKRRAQQLKKARAARKIESRPPLLYRPPQRELSPIREVPEEVHEIEESTPNYNFDFDSFDSSHASPDSDDNYEELESNFLMSMKSLTCMCNNLACSKCGQAGKLTISVPTFNGFKVTIAVTCTASVNNIKCGYTFEHILYEKKDVNRAVIRALISNGISFAAFQRFLIIMGFSYWSNQRNRYLSIDLKSHAFDSSRENDAIIEKANQSEKRMLMLAVRSKELITISYDATYKTRGYNSRTCFGAIMVNKMVVSSDVVKKEMRSSFKGIAYGNLENINSQDMEKFLFQKLLRQIIPLVGPKIKEIVTDGDARLGTVAKQLTWRTADSETINPISSKPSCSADEVGKSVWPNAKPPALFTDKVIIHSYCIKKRSRTQIR